MEQRFKHYRANLDLEALDTLASRLEQGDTIVAHYKRPQGARQLKIHWHLYASRMRDMLDDPFWGMNILVTVEGSDGDWRVTFQPRPPLAWVEEKDGEVKQ